MVQWEYEVTVHELPVSQPEKEARSFACNQDGLCFIHDAYPGGIKWLEDLFGEKGKKGWELVQSGYHHRELLCIWKRRKEITRTD